MLRCPDAPGLSLAATSLLVAVFNLTPIFDAQNKG
jgi:hypothetical protein